MPVPCLEDALGTRNQQQPHRLENLTVQPRPGSNGQDHWLPTHEEMDERACQIYVAQGSPPGHEVDDWLPAQYALMPLPLRKIVGLEPPKTGRAMPLGKSIVGLVPMAWLLGSDGRTQFGR